MGLELLFGCLGILYGYQKPGVEDPKAIFKKGARAGLVLAVLTGILVAYADPGSALLNFGAGFVGMILWILYLTIIFITGAVVGDFFEVSIKR